ncbi:recombinase family protein [Curtobacterium sp. TC1]|uniref:recombinase family protein n=1 Tax=Curtobacterium sp. TC1 TaxID=2862880 RepID=UPI001C9A358B|nr:recombinase family protein [Curtobacterium sp. TC1]
MAPADCIGYVRVASTDRLARSLGGLRDIVADFTAKGASVEFGKEQQTYSRDTDDAIGRLMLNLLGAFAEFERTLICDSSAPASRSPQSLEDLVSTEPPCTGCWPRPSPLPLRTQPSATSPACSVQRPGLTHTAITTRRIAGGMEFLTVRGLHRSAATTIGAAVVGRWWRRDSPFPISASAAAATRARR